MKNIALLVIMIASLALVSCGGRGAKKAAAEAAQTEQIAVEKAAECAGDACCTDKAEGEACCGKCADKAEGECCGKCADKAEGEDCCAEKATMTKIENVKSEHKSPKSLKAAEAKEEKMKEIKAEKAKAVKLEAK